MLNFDKYRNGIITIEVQSLMPEKFINLLWKNGVYIKNIKKINITTMTMEVNLKNYSLIEEISKKTGTKIKIIGRRGITFFFLKMRKRAALIGGIGIFILILYCLSNFIWSIDIVTDHNLTPYEIRQQLLELGIKPGINKKNINVYQLEEKLKNNDSIMWCRVRIEGSELKVSTIERTSPPNVVVENEPCNLVAKKDGQIVRVYTTAGTPVVKAGDIIKTGQILVKGEQGKEGSVYTVHAKGDVIAKTFYEEIKEVPVKGVKKVRTGNSAESLYIEIKGKRFYFKNDLNKFKIYDKIEGNKGIIKKETYYEVKEEKFDLDPKKVIDETADELFQKISVNLDKSVVIKDKKVDAQPVGDNYKIRLLVIAEENIALPEKTEQ